MINNAHDRGTAAKAMFKALGIKTHSIHFSTFAGDIICIIEGKTEQMGSGRRHQYGQRRSSIDLE